MATKSTNETKTASDSSGLDKSYQEYAVCTVGGGQQIVCKGDIVQLDKRDVKTGDKLVIDDVLALRTKDKFELGTPLVKGASIQATVIEEDHKGVKLQVMHKRRRKHSKTSIGHRQHYTLVHVDAIKGS